jgi:hypothetical protein
MNIKIQARVLLLVQTVTMILVKLIVITTQVIVMSLVQQGIRLIVLRLIVKVRGQIQAAVVLLVVMETNCKHTQFL